MRVFLVRHTPVAVGESTCYGRSDVALAAGWLDAVLATKAKLSQRALAESRVWSSPLDRCVKLADQLGPDFTTDERLREYDFGRWELMPWQAIPVEEIRPWSANIVEAPAPGGESLRQVHDRVSDFWESCVADQGDAIVVSHGGVIRCLLARALNMPLKDMFRINVDYGSVSAIHLGQRGPRVNYINR